MYPSLSLPTWYAFSYWPKWWFRSPILTSIKKGLSSPFILIKKSTRLSPSSSSLVSLSKYSIRSISKSGKKKWMKIRLKSGQAWHNAQVMSDKSFSLYRLVARYSKNSFIIMILNYSLHVRFAPEQISEIILGITNGNDCRL